MEFSNNKVISFLITFAVIAGFTGTMFSLDARFAKSSDINYVSEKVDRHLIEKRIEFVQEKIWNMEDRWNERYFKQHEEYPETNEQLVAFMNEEARETYRDLKKELKELEHQLEGMDTKDA